MKVINLFGGPGSGKSTTAAGIFYKMKLRHMSVELVSEYAKKLLYANRLDVMLDQQEYIFAKQNHLLHNLRDRVDYAVTDSPLLLSNVYATDDWPGIKPFKELVTSTYDTYDNINIVLNRPSEFQQYGRRHDLDESKKIDQVVFDVLKDAGVNYYTFPCDSHVVDNIVNSGLIT